MIPQTQAGIVPAFYLLPGPEGVKITTNNFQTPPPSLPFAIATPFPNQQLSFPHPPPYTHNQGHLQLIIPNLPPPGFKPHPVPTVTTISEYGQRQQRLSSSSSHKSQKPPPPQKPHALKQPLREIQLPFLAEPTSLSSSSKGNKSQHKLKDRNLSLSSPTWKKPSALPSGNVYHHYEPLYKTLLCNAYINYGECRYGQACRFAHGERELRQYPGPSISSPNVKYKTVDCKNYSENGVCHYGDKCQFRHPGDLPINTLPSLINNNKMTAVTGAPRKA